jgi:hypothetical protein
LSHLKWRRWKLLHLYLVLSSSFSNSVPRRKTLRLLLLVVAAAWLYVIRLSLTYSMEAAALNCVFKEKCEAGSFKKNVRYKGKGNCGREANNNIGVDVAI